MEPRIIFGNCHTDTRGKLFYNNDFDTTAVKRIYSIENCSIDFIRAWQGHKIEQRWFSAVQGKFEIKLIEIDRWENPSPKLESKTFELDSRNLDVLHIPCGFVSSIEALEENSKLLVFADHFLNEISDEYRFNLNYFENEDY